MVTKWAIPEGPASSARMAMRCIVLFTMICLVLFLADGSTGEKEDVILVWSQGSDDKETVEHGRSVTFNLSVKVGTDRPFVNGVYQVVGLPESWPSVLITGDTEDATGWDPTFMYKAGIQYRLWVKITHPLGTLNDTYWFTLKAHLEENESAQYDLRLGVVVRQYADFEWANSYVPTDPPPGDEFKALPSDNVSVRLALYNTGNGYDRFSIHAESSRPDEVRSLSFMSGVNRENLTSVLPPDRFKKRPYYIVVSVTVAPEGLAGTTTQFTIDAKSLFNTSLVKPPAFFAVTSLQYFEFEVNVDGPGSKDGIPGEEVEFQLKIRNLGNGWDTFQIKPIWDLELNPGFIAAANPRQVDIEARTGRTIQYVVKVPEGAPKKTFFFTAEIKSSSPELTPVTKRFAVKVLQYFDLDMTSQGPSNASTIPGGNLEFNVTLLNSGNGLDSIVVKDIKGTPEGWLAYAQPPEVTLLQGQVTTIKVIVIVPSQFEEAPIGSYILTVIAVSSRSDARAEHHLGVEITKMHRIEWLYQGESITSPIKPRHSFNPYQKSTINITLELKNFGNSDDNVTLETYCPDTRITSEVNPAFTYLKSGQVTQIKVSIVVPKDIPPGIYNAFVNASLTGYDLWPRVLPLDFEIENNDVAVPPIPTYIDPNGGIVRNLIVLEKGMNKTLKLKIHNNGTRPLNGVEVKGFDIYDVDGEEIRWNFFNFTSPTIPVGQTFTVGERPFTPTNPPLVWWGNRSGNHTLEFRVYYPYQSCTTNDISRLNLTVEEPASQEDPHISRWTIRWIAIGILSIAISALVTVGMHLWIKELKEPKRKW
jgi:uncharacterized membrane protein